MSMVNFRASFLHLTKDNIAYRPMQMVIAVYIVGLLPYRNMTF